jgi:hypothetical protein
MCLWCNFSLISHQHGRSNSWRERSIEVRAGADRNFSWGGNDAKAIALYLLNNIMYSRNILKAVIYISLAVIHLMKTVVARLVIGFHFSLRRQERTSRLSHHHDVKTTIPLPFQEADSSE